MKLEQVEIPDTTAVDQGEVLVGGKKLRLESSQEPQPPELLSLRKASVLTLDLGAKEEPDEGKVEITAQKNKEHVERDFLIPKLEDLPEKSRQLVQAKIDEIRSETGSLKRIKTETEGIEVPERVEGSSSLDDLELQASEQLKQELQFLEQMHSRLINGELKEDVSNNQNAVKRLLNWGRNAINKKGYETDRQAKLINEIEDFNQRFDALSQRMKEFLPRKRVKAELALFSESNEELQDDKVIELIQGNRGQLVALVAQTDHSLAKERVLRPVFSQTKLTKLSGQTGKVRTTVELKGEYSRDCEYPVIVAKQGYESEQWRMLMIERSVLEARNRKALQLRESVNALFKSTSDRYGETGYAHICEELISACHELSVALGESGSKGLMSDSHIESVVRVQVGINKRIGESTDIMYHNGSVSMLGAILASGGLKSHAQLLAEGRSYTFTTAGGFQVSREGIEHNGKVITWGEYRKNGLGINTNKDPLMEHHQILLSHEGPYYRREPWTIAIPERALLDYQISGNQDGYHLFDPNFNNDVNKPISDDSVGTENGTNIDFSQTPFVVLVEAGAKEVLVPQIKAALGISDENFQQWSQKHLLVVNDINTRETSEQVRGHFFNGNNFDIPKRKGVFVPTGNKGETANGTWAHLYRYAS